METRVRLLSAVAGLLALAAVVWFLLQGSSPLPGTAEPAPHGTGPAAPPAPALPPSPGPDAPAAAAREEVPGEPKDAPAVEEIRGTVSLATDRPAVGATVIAWDLDRIAAGGKAVVTGEARTGADGHATLRCPPVGGRVLVYATMDGMASAGVVVAPRTPREEFRIVLGGGGILVGTLLDPEGSPVPDHEVRLWPAHRWAHAPDSGSWRAWFAPEIWDRYGSRIRTDVRGRYRFEGLPLPRGGFPEPVSAVALDAEGRAWSTPEIAMREAGETRDVDLRMGDRPWIGDTDVPPDFPSVVSGRVLVAGTGAPVAGAHVLKVAALGPNASWWGSTTGEDGGFRIDTGDFRPGDHEMEIRVKAEGFLPWKGPPGEPGMEIRLQPAAGDPAPGRIRGVARLPDGSPVTGLLEATLIDDMLQSEGRCTVADASGFFLLEGVPPGPWSVQVGGCRVWADAVVPEGGEVEAGFLFERARDPLPAWTEESQSVMDRLHGELYLLRRAREAGEATVRIGDGPPVPVEKRLEEVIRRLSDLESIKVASLPRREVEVTGLPGDPYTTLEAEGNRRRWVKEVMDGRVRFPWLETGKWTLTLRRRGAEPVIRNVEVPEGEDPLVLDFRSTR